VSIVACPAGQYTQPITSHFTTFVYQSQSCHIHLLLITEGYRRGGQVPHPRYARNCFCDPVCTVYDDCCKDYEGPRDDEVGWSSARFTLPRAAIACQRVPDVSPTADGTPSAEMYIVTKCAASLRSTVAPSAGVSRRNMGGATNE